MAKAKAKQELVGNPCTGKFDVAESAPRGVKTFLSLSRAPGGNYQVLEIRVDLDEGVVVTEIGHEPTLKAFAEDEFKIAVVKRTWSGVD